MEWNVVWGWLGRELDMHAYDVYFLRSQPPLSYYLIVTEFRQ